MRLETSIEQVTVYAGAARVRRRAAVEVGAEAQVIRIGGLPLAMRDDSVRLAADGPFVAADARVVLEVPEGEALPPADPEALDAARREVAIAEAEVARLGRALEALAALAPGARPPSPTDEPPPAWTAAVEARLGLVALRGERERAIRDELAVANRRVVEARRRLDRAEDDDRRASSARAARPHELRKAVVVTVRPDGAGGRGALAVEYVVPGARWAPTYVARIAGGVARVELRAVIAQQTGEDWTGVALALSTAAALAWTELPELPSLRIGRRQAALPRAGWRPPPSGAEALYADRDRAFGPPAPETTMTFAAPPGQVPAPGALPPPQAAAPFRGPPPSPEMMPMPMAAAKRGGGGGIGAAIGGIVAAPAALVAAGAGAVAKSLRGRAEPQGSAGGAPGAHDDAELVPDADLLAYGDLEMPPATSRSRGKLTPVAARDRYLAVLAQAKVTVTFDVLVAITEAERRAGEVARRAPPDGASAEWPATYAYAFRADGAVDVPSDGTWHAIALGVRDAAVKLRHVVVPREATDAFRLAHLDNPHDAPLLPGPMDVYDGAEFLLTTHVPFTPPRGALELGLGVDPRVKVARNARYREETAGMLRGSLRLEHEVAIDVENLTGRAIDLEVRERIPVRADEDDDDVEVVVGAVTPAWEPWAPEPERPGERRLRGGHRWRLDLPAGARRTLSAAYRVEIASKHELVGGNRREA